MKKLLIALATTVALVGPAAAGGTFTYMCRVGDKLYPVTVTTPNKRDCDRPYTVCNLSGGTIKWRGVTFRNVSGTYEDCKAKFTATRNSVHVELCTATKGYASLTISGDYGEENEYGLDEGTFDCE